MNLKGSKLGHSNLMIVIKYFASVVVYWLRNKVVILDMVS